MRTKNLRTRKVINPCTECPYDTVGPNNKIWAKCREGNDKIKC